MRCCGPSELAKARRAGLVRDQVQPPRTLDSPIGPSRHGCLGYGVLHGLYTRIGHRDLPVAELPSSIMPVARVYLGARLHHFSWVHVSPQGSIDYLLEGTLCPATRTHFFSLGIGHVLHRSAFRRRFLRRRASPSSRETVWGCESACLSY